MKRFDKFGVFNYLDLLSNKDVTKWDEILNLKCSVVLIALMLRNEQQEFEENLHKAKQKKIKQGSK